MPVALKEVGGLHIVQVSWTIIFKQKQEMIAMGFFFFFWNNGFTCARSYYKYNDCQDAQHIYICCISENRLYFFIPKNQYELHAQIEIISLGYALFLKIQT